MFDLLYAIATLLNYAFTAFMVVGFFALIVIIMLAIGSPPLKTNEPTQDPYFDEIEEYRSDFE